MPIKETTEQMYARLAKTPRKPEYGNKHAPKKTKKIDDKLLESLIEREYGNVNLIYLAIKKRLKEDGVTITYDAVRRRIMDNPRYLALKEAAEERWMDLAEDSLVDALKKKKPWATELALKTKGRKRGYAAEEEKPTTIEIKVIDYNNNGKIIKAEDASYRDLGTAQLSTEGVPEADNAGV